MNTNLTECDDCGKSVSINAQTCPHCGMKYPTAEAKAQEISDREGVDFSIRFLIWVIFFIGLLFWLISKCTK